MSEREEAKKAVEEVMSGEMSLEEQAQRLFNISMKTPEHLKAWLEESGRVWIVLNSVELVDALPFPGGHDHLMQIIACYRDHRATITTGRFEKQMDPRKKKEVEIPIMKKETLEKEELDRAIRYLVGQITEMDPSWSLENPPM